MKALRQGYRIADNSIRRRISLAKKSKGHPAAGGLSSLDDVLAMETETTPGSWELA
jgi:hypothetical protein